MLALVVSCLVVAFTIMPYSVFPVLEGPEARLASSESIALQPSRSPFPTTSGGHIHFSPQYSSHVHLSTFMPYVSPVRLTEGSDSRDRPLALSEPSTSCSPVNYNTFNCTLPPIMVPAAPQYFPCLPQEVVLSLCVLTCREAIASGDAVVIDWFPSSSIPITVRYDANGDSVTVDDGPVAGVVIAINDSVVHGKTSAVMNQQVYIDPNQAYLRWESTVTSGMKSVAEPVHTLIALTQHNCDSFQHFVFDCLPRLELALHVMSSYPTAHLLVSPGPFFADIGVEVLGSLLANHTVVTAQPGYVYPARTILVPHWIERWSMGFMLPQGLSMSAAALRSPLPVTRRTVLYLGRKPGRPRSVVNEGEMLRVVSSRLSPGLELVSLLDPQEWRSYRATVAGALYLMSPHGGALSSMIFLHPGAVVVEFLGTQGFVTRAMGNVKGKHVRNCFAGLASGLNLTLYRHQPAEFKSYNLPMVVNITSLMMLLHGIGAAV